jgi:hypothetical protein
MMKYEHENLMMRRSTTTSIGLVSFFPHSNLLKKKEAKKFTMIKFTLFGLKITALKWREPFFRKACR